MYCLYLTIWFFFLLLSTMWESSFVHFIHENADLNFLRQLVPILCWPTYVRVYAPWKNFTRINNAFKKSLVHTAVYHSTSKSVSAKKKTRIFSTLWRKSRAQLPKGERVSRLRRAGKIDVWSPRNEWFLFLLLFFFLRTIAWCGRRAVPIAKLVLMILETEKEFPFFFPNTLSRDERDMMTASTAQLSATPAWTVHKFYWQLSFFFCKKNNNFYSTETVLMAALLLLKIDTRMGFDRFAKTECLTIFHTSRVTYENNFSGRLSFPRCFNWRAWESEAVGDGALTKIRPNNLLKS